MLQQTAKQAILRAVRPGLESIIDRFEFEAVTHCWCGGRLKPWLEEFWPYDECSDCGCKAVRFRPTRECLRTFYAEHYWYGYQTIHGCPSIEQRYEDDMVDRVHVYMEWVRELKEPPARLLEIGCGNGRLLHELSRAGYECHGTDMDPRVAAWVRAKTGLPITSGGWPRSSEPTFDIVVILDVLEHVPDPVEFSRTVRSYLGRDGGVLVHCPMINSEADAVRLRHMFNVLSHLWMHNDDSLAKLWRPLGLRPRRMGELFGMDCFGFVS